MPGEIARAQVRAGAIEEHPARAEAEKRPERRAHDADERALEGEHRDEAAPRDAQRAQ